MLLAGKIHLRENASVMSSGFPTDLFAKASLVASSLERPEQTEEIKEDGFKKMPVFSAAGKESAKPKFVAFGFVDVDDRQVALATGGNFETEPILALGLEEFEKTLVNKGRDFVLAGIL